MPSCLLVNVCRLHKFLSHTKHAHHKLLGDVPQILYGYYVYRSNYDPISLVAAVSLGTLVLGFVYCAPIDLRLRFRTGTHYPR
jgi:hypothetical protein